MAGFAALTIWPAGAWRQRPAPWALRLAVSASAVGMLLGLLAWFGAEVALQAGQAGLAERVLGVMQVLWPLVVTLSCSVTGSADETIRP